MTNANNEMTEWNNLIPLQVNIIPANDLRKLAIKPNNLINEKMKLIAYTCEQTKRLGKWNLISKISNITQSNCENLNLIKLFENSETVITRFGF